MNKRRKTHGPVWRLLSSIRTTVVLLVAIAGSSIVGTLIPQGNDASAFLQSLNPTLADVLAKFGFFNLYHSFWFRMLILALVLNLIVCSISRFPGSLALFRLRSKTDDIPETCTRIEKVLLPNTSLSNVSSTAYELLSRKYRTVEKAETGPERHVLYAEKGRYSFFSVYIVHSAILLILTGAIIGSISGFEGYVTIPEGETVNTFILKNSDTEMKLPFAVKLEKFNVSFYGDGSPKEYHSDLSFIAEGQADDRRKVLVNHPATYKGITFYQSSYGTIPSDTVRITISKEASKTKPIYLEMKNGVDYSLPDSDGKIALIDAQPDFMHMGPAVKLSITPTGKDEIQIWVFKNHHVIRRMLPGFFEQSPRFNAALYKPYTFGLQNIETVFFSGLQVSKDPGVALVWTGFLMLTAGLFITFFVPFKRIWILINSDQSGVVMTISGNAKKNSFCLEKELESYHKRIEKSLK